MAGHVGTALVTEWQPVGWAPDATVGWRLEGTWSCYGMPIAHSMRIPANTAFPVSAFLRLLRHVGVSDL